MLVKGTTTIGRRCYQYQQQHQHWHSYISCESLTHWGQVTHRCVSNLTIIGSDNGLSPVRRQAIIWTNAGILFIGSLGTNFSEILIEILAFSFKKIRLKVSSEKWWPFCLSLNVLRCHYNHLCTFRKLPEFNAIWNEKKEQLPALVERYKRLKEECVKLGHL